MSSIRVSGNTSGHYDLTVPDVAGSNTIALDKIVVTDSSGNVGIGTSSPSHKLSVITDVDSFVMKVENDGNSAGTVGNAYADASDGLWVDTRWNTATNTPFKVTSNSGTADMMIIKGDGKVGIGTAQPDLTLHVDGVNGYPATSGSTPVGHIAIRAKNESSSHGANIGVANASPWGTWIQAQDANNLATNYPLLLNPNGGNVGIGTTSPQDALTIQTAHNKRVLTIENDNGNDVFQFVNNDGGGNAEIRMWKNSESGTHTQNVEIRANGNSYFNGGNVGIGTNSPDYKTHSAIDYAGNDYLGDAGVYAIGITNEDTTATNAVGMAFGHGTYNYTHYIASIRKSSGANPWGDLSIGGRPSDAAGFVDRIYLQGNTGNVGIGTNSPNATLTVSQSANNIFAVERTGVASGSGQFGINVENNSQATVSYDDGSQLVFGTASSPSTHVGFTERMKISAEGYVTKPNHPAFQALAQGASNSNSGGYLDFTHTILNQGNHFSTTNNRFTAPVAGVYHFHFHTFIDQSSTGTGQISFYKNGSYSFSGYEIRNYHAHRSTGYGPTMVLTATVGLNKFDYIQIYNAGIDLHANASNYFGGHLIG